MLLQTGVLAADLLAQDFVLGNVMEVAEEIVIQNLPEITEHRRKELVAQKQIHQVPL